MYRIPFLIMVSLMTQHARVRGMLSHDIETSENKVLLVNSSQEAGYSYQPVSNDDEQQTKLMDNVEEVDNFSHGVTLLNNNDSLKIDILNHKASKITLETESKADFTFSYSVVCAKLHRNLQLMVKVPHSETLNVELNGENKIYISCDTSSNKSLNQYVHNNISENSLKNTLVMEKGHNESVSIRQGYINMTLHGGLIGVSQINFRLYSVKSDKRSETNEKESLQRFKSVLYIQDHTWQTVNYQNLTLWKTVSIEILVVRTPKAIDVVFLILIYLMEIVQMVALGSLVEVEDFKKTLKRPLPTIFGLVSQYVIMTLVAYAGARILKGDNLLDAAGTFVVGICPSGSASNIYAYLLYGDLALSLTITLLSYVAAFAMMPLWVYTIGQEFFPGYDVIIPYTDIVIMIAVSIPPLIVGMLIRRRFPHFVDQLQNILTPVIVLVAVGFLSTGIYASMYMFYLLDLRLAIVGCAVSFIGYILGAVIMLPLKQSRKKAITMSVELGMKNTGVGYALLLNTMPPPLCDIAAVVTAASEIASQIPPLLVSIVVFVKELCMKKYKPVEQDVNDVEEATDDEVEELKVKHKIND